MLQDKIKDNIECDVNMNCITVALPQDIREKIVELLDIIEDSVTLTNTHMCFFSLFYDRDVSISALKTVWDLDKIQEVLLNLSGGDRRIINILFNINTYVYDNNYKVNLSLREFMALKNTVKQDKKYITLTHIELMYILLLLIHSFLSVKDVDSVFKQYRNTLSGRLNLNDKKTYYTVGYYQDLSLEEKQNIIKYLMCLFIDIKF